MAEMLQAAAVETKKSVGGVSRNAKIYLDISNFMSTAK
jgi:hypothetical protein